MVDRASFVRRWELKLSFIRKCPEMRGLRGKWNSGRGNGSGFLNCLILWTTALLPRHTQLWMKWERGLEIKKICAFQYNNSYSPERDSDVISLLIRRCTLWRKHFTATLCTIPIASFLWRSSNETVFLCSSQFSSFHVLFHMNCLKVL